MGCCHDKYQPDMCVVVPGVINFFLSHYQYLHLCIGTRLILACFFVDECFIEFDHTLQYDIELAVLVLSFFGFDLVSMETIFF